MEPHEDHVPEIPPTAKEAQLMEEVHTVLHDAKYGLTEDGILAVVAIRRYRAIVSAIEDLILMGKLDAERRPGVSEDTLPSLHDYVFRALSDEEQAQLRTLKKGAPGDELAS
jgi:hypothetical protein